MQPFETDRQEQLCPTQNGLLNQKLCRYINQGRTLNDIFMRAAHLMAYFELCKLNFFES